MDNKYVRLKVPKEFKKWAEYKRMNMESIAKEMGYKKRFSLNKALRVISKNNSDIIINQESIEDVLKKKRK